jgi:F-type H+-transporting ATPase subunit a
MTETKEVGLFQLPLHIPELRAEKLGEFFNFPITNAITMSLLGTLFILILCLWAQTFRVKNPGKAQLFIEDAVEYFKNFFTGVIGKPEVIKDVLPLIASICIFILFENIFPIFLPFLTALTFHEIPLFRIHNSDLNATLGMALSLFIITNAYGIQKIGARYHLGKFLKFEEWFSESKKGISGFFLGFISFFVGVLELIGELAKILSLSLRLFGNIFAGEILLSVFLYLFGVVLPVPILLLGLLVGVIQAIVFSSLTAAKFAEFSNNH